MEYNPFTIPLLYSSNMAAIKVECPKVHIIYAILFYAMLIIMIPMIILLAYLLK